MKRSPGKPSLTQASSKKKEAQETRKKGTSGSPSYAKTHIWVPPPPPTFHFHTPEQNNGDLIGFQGK